MSRWGDNSNVYEVDKLTWYNSNGNGIAMGYVYQTNDDGLFWSPATDVSVSTGFASVTVLTPYNVQGLNNNILAEKDLDNEFREQDPNGTAVRVEESPCKS